MSSLSSWLRRLARRSGLWSPSIYPCESGSSVGSAGTIILIRRSRSAGGAKRRSGYCSWCIDSSRTNGLRLRRSWKDVLITQSRITGIAQWNGSLGIWPRPWGSTSWELSRLPAPNLKCLVLLLQSYKSSSKKLKANILRRSSSKWKPKTKSTSRPRLRSSSANKTRTYSPSPVPTCSSWALPILTARQSNKTWNTSYHNYQNNQITAKTWKILMQISKKL